MTIILPTSTLAFDGTANNTSNLKTDIFTTLTSPALITTYGPFYTNNLVVTGVPVSGGSAVPLVLFQDYQFSPIFQLESQNTGFFVYSYILLNSYTNWSSVTVEYQAVGGTSTDTMLQTQITQVGNFDITILDNWLSFTGDLGVLNNLDGGLTNINTVYTLAAQISALTIALRTPSTYLSFINTQFIPLASEVTNLNASFNSLSTSLTNGGFLTANSIRTRLASSLTIYVSPTGNDTLLNAGLTSGSPLQSIQAAWNLITNNYDLNGQIANILLLPGTYTEGLVAKGLLVGQQSASQLVIGAATTGTVTIAINAAGSNLNNSATTANNISLLYGAVATLTNITFTNAYSASGTGNAVDVQSNSRVVISSGIVFGAITGNDISAQYNSHVTISSSYTVSGNMVNHWYANSNSVIQVTSGIVPVLTGVVTFTDFAVADYCSNIFCTGLTFTTTGATVIGTRYSVNHNSVIDAGGVATYLPGSINGTTPLNGGIYV